jgi:transcriptional regulator with GAF, ATPase, and Fis domain
MTDQPRAFEVLAAASSAMLTDQHVGDVLAQLMTDCLEPLSAHAAAILIVDDSQLALLSASTHRAAELEMLQTQESEGPCVEVIETGQIVVAAGEEMVERWDNVGRAIRDAGFVSVHAFPLRWQGHVLGGLNVFRTADDEQSADTEQVGQAFADVATLVVVRAAEIPVDQVAARIHEAVAARSVVEQAKGVLAHLHRVEMDQAFQLLAQRAVQDGDSLTVTALGIVKEQHE